MFEKRPKIITLDSINDFCSKKAERQHINHKDKKISIKEETTINSGTVENKIPIKIKKEKDITVKHNLKKEAKSEEIILWL